MRPYFEPDLQLLKSLPLEKLNGGSPAEFWKKFDAERQKEAEFVESLAKLPPDEQARAWRRRPIFQGISSTRSPMAP